jgi:hypothetical protein
MNAIFHSPEARTGWGDEEVQAAAIEKLDWVRCGFAAADRRIGEK